METEIYQVDAFSSEMFGGNPAAIMPLDAWLPDDTLQSVAMENNLSETAFLVAVPGGFELRWFTPAVEVDLCGHATLAAAHVLYRHLGHGDGPILFQTRSGQLRVSAEGDRIRMDFPAATLEPQPVDEAVSAALGARAIEAAGPPGKASMALYRFASEAEVAALTPDFAALLQASDRSVICTAPGDTVDFVSRFFGPQVGINEDPVTGSAHCLLTPYWSAQLGRDRLQARQISPRGGELWCELHGDRVFMSGQAVTVMKGVVYL